MVISLVFIRLPVVKFMLASGYIRLISYFGACAVDRQSVGVVLVFYHHNLLLDCCARAIGALRTIQLVIYIRSTGEVWRHCTN